jgi:hypothetical protein
MLWFSARETDTPQSDVIEKFWLLPAGAIDRRTLADWAVSYTLDDGNDLYDVLVGLEMANLTHCSRKNTGLNLRKFPVDCQWFSQFVLMGTMVSL